MLRQTIHISELVRNLVVLETENLVIRSLEPADIGPDIVAWYADPDVMKYMTALPLNASRKLICAQVQQAIRSGGHYFGIFDRKSNSPIGFITTFRNRANKSIRTSLALGDRNYWGTGAMNEARTAVIDYLFNKTDTEKVISIVFSRNFPAIANNKALGFQLEGILREHDRTDPTGPRDLCMYGLLKREWLAQRESDSS